ncbi:MAG: hypothetical protein CMA70_00075 [Euryarchaeota archaeon]|nr:hypothetical protein [Euryarchaeota archaeon]
MATLIIVDWMMKRFQNSGFDNLIDKIKPKTIKIVHSPECDVGVDLIGDSIYRKNLLKGINISLHPHRSVIQGPRFKRGDFDEESHWGTNVSALIKELDLDIGTHIEDKDLHICATGGSTYLLGCLMTVGEVIGSHIWTLLPNTPAFIPEAIEVTMDSSFELSHEADAPTTRPLNEKESGMLSIMAERGNCKMKDWIPSDAIASTKYDLARQQGLSTIAKSLEEGGMIERRGAEPVEYRLTDMGLIHAIYHLSKNEFRLEPFIGSEGAVIIFHNGKESPDEESKRLRGYLDEHGLPGGFSKYALIVLEYGNDRDRAEKVADRIGEVVPLYDLIDKDVKSISNLMCEGELEFYDSLGRLLNVIRDASEGYRGKCSLVIDKIPSHLISSVLRYCRISGISVISILKKRPSTGITGSNTETKLDKLKHRFRLPNDFEIEAVRKGIEISSRETMEDSRNARRVIATILCEKDAGGRGVIESSKELGRYNQEHVSGDLMLADPDGATGRQQRSRGITAAEKYGLIRREGKESLSLTAAGEVLARLSLMRGR